MTDATQSNQAAWRAQRRPQDSIQPLVLAAMDHDSTASDEVFRRLQEPFTKYFQRRTGNAADADELASQTLAEGLQRLRNGAYDPNKATFLTFVYRIAQNRLVDWQRRQVRNRVQVTADGAVPDILTTDPTDMAMMQLEEIEAMRVCLGAEDSPHGLTPAERLVVVGRANAETLESLARQIGRSVTVTHGRYRAAIEKLRQCMKSKGHL